MVWQGLDVKALRQGSTIETGHRAFARVPHFSTPTDGVAAGPPTEPRWEGRRSSRDGCNVSGPVRELGGDARKDVTVGVASGAPSLVAFYCANEPAIFHPLSQTRVYTNPRGTSFGRGGKPFTPHHQQAEKPLPPSYVCYRCGQKGTGLHCVAGDDCLTSV